MKDNFSFSKKTIAAIIFVLGITCLLVGCEKVVTLKEGTSTSTNYIPAKTITPTPKPKTQTPTLTEISSTATPSEDYFWFDDLATIDFTQEPADVTTHEAPDNKYLYKYANVTFFIPWRDETRRYLNLDDLNDNDPANSDIVIDHSLGSGGDFIELVPTNGATFYFSGLHSMSLNSCLEHFPFINMDEDFYHEQMWRVDSGRDYCVLTDDGRLSIIRYVDLVYLPNDWEHVNLELVVTTYRQIVPQALTPLPTPTPGPSPTPGRYSGMNLTQKQQAILDKNAQLFLDAVIAYDKNAIANLIEFPSTLYFEGDQYVTYINNKEEFLASYDRVFTHDLIEELKNASVSENMGIHDRGALNLIVKDCAIFFYPNGKIEGISKTSYWWKIDNEKQ